MGCAAVDLAVLDSCDCGGLGHFPPAASLRPNQSFLKITSRGQQAQLFQLNMPMEGRFFEGFPIVSHNIGLDWICSYHSEKSFKAFDVSWNVKVINQSCLPLITWIYLNLVPSSSYIARVGTTFFQLPCKIGLLRNCREMPVLRMKKQRLPAKQLKRGCQCWPC